MRHLILTVLLLIWASVASSQHTDIIKLKNSEIVRGTITETIPGVSVSIFALPDSAMRVIPFSEIEKVIYKEGTPPIDMSKQVRQSLDNSNGGYSSFNGFLRVGYVAQIVENEEYVSNSFFKADLMLGASFGGKASLGVGFGVRLGQNENTLLPLFLDLRVAPLKGPISPMAAISVGINFQTDMDYNVQKFINPEIGIRLGNSSGTNVMFALGVEIFDFFSERKTPSKFGGIRNTTGLMAYYGYSFSVILGF